MLTKEQAFQLCMKPPYTTSWFELIMKADYNSFINKVYSDFESHICDNCKHDYCGCSVQDSILQVDPEATFTTFGCNSFTSKD